jgi:hypothetical protein
MEMTFPEAGLMRSFWSFQGSLASNLSFREGFIPLICEEPGKKQPREVLSTHGVDDWRRTEVALC